MCLLENARNNGEWITIVKHYVKALIYNIFKTDPSIKFVKL